MYETYVWCSPLLLFHLKIQERFGGSLDRPVPADRLSLCRILVAVTEILDVPRAFLEEAAARSRSLQLEYDLLGQREMVHLENPVAGDVMETQGGDGAVGAAVGRRYTGSRDGDERSDTRRGRRDAERGLLATIPVNHFRYVVTCLTTWPSIHYHTLQASEQTGR